MAKPNIKDIFHSLEYGPAPESDAKAKEWLARHSNRFGHYINGAWTHTDSGELMTTSNPATGQKLAVFTNGTAQDVDAAVKSARAAQEKWAEDGYARAKFLYAMARHLQKNARLFSTLETLDNGKPIRETRDADIPLAVRHFSHHAGWAQMLEDEFPGHTAHGVVGQITPWNFPLLMLAWKVAPALAAGNTIVLKPAEDTPLTALKFAELCNDIGLPPGVLNIVTGDGQTGAHLVEHPDVDKIAFTGSTEVGRIIRKATAGTGKTLTLELGGKSPTIVFEDADLDAAVEGIVDSIFFNQGEVCCAGSRLLVQEGIHDSFVGKLKTRLQHLRVGDPMDKNTDMGAVVSEEQFKRINSYIEKGREEGAEVFRVCDTIPTGGNFIAPTIMTNVTPSSTVAQEEIFGPVLAVMPFRHPAEAVQLANNTRYGLAATVWTENINKATETAAQIQAGVIWLNSANMFDGGVGFGGYKESGYGREGGKEGMYAYLKSKIELPLYPLNDTTSPAPQPLKRTDDPAIDRTAKLYIGGKQARPDSGYSLDILSPDGRIVGQVGEGSRKDIRNAVAAARKETKWAGATQYNRAQVMQYIAENMEARADEFAASISAMTGKTEKDARREVATAIRRQFYYAAWCDKFEGRVHMPPAKAIVPALNEPLGILGIVCPDEDPLLSFTSLVAPAIAMGNRVVVVPSEKHPLSATSMYQVYDTSDLPAGTVSIVTGTRAALAKTLAEHDDVDAMWYFGPEEAMSRMVEDASAGNLKQTWVNHAEKRNWHNDAQAQGEEFLRRGTQVKNVWIPYGVQV